MFLKFFMFLVAAMRRFPLLHKATWKTRKTYHRLRRVILVGRPVIDGTEVLKQAILDQHPYAAGKMGSIEATTVAQFLKRQQARAAGRVPPSYKPYQFLTLHVNAGVFPQDADTYDAFSKTYLEAASHCNVLGTWDVAGEAEILRGYCPAATLVTLRSLDPFYAPHPWTASLHGKRVLVISPFTASIQAQYAKRHLLWDNARMLPDFELFTIRAPLSAGITIPEDESWFAALDRLKREMDALDYDVALIGAGAFSLPLAVHAKQSGKIGIHLGGSTQALFGVYGNRWLNWDYFRPFIKDSWVRPAPSETPPESKKIENAAYW